MRRLDPESVGELLGTSNNGRLCRMIPDAVFNLVARLFTALISRELKPAHTVAPRGCKSRPAGLREYLSPSLRARRRTCASEDPNWEVLIIDPCEFYCTPHHWTYDDTVIGVPACGDVVGGARDDRAGDRTIQNHVAEQGAGNENVVRANPTAPSDE